MSPTCKAIVGRDEKENDLIEQFAGDNDYLMKIEDFGSPITFYQENVRKLLFLVQLRYVQDILMQDTLRRAAVTVFNKNNSYILKVAPADESLLETYRVEKKNRALTVKI